MSYKGPLDYIDVATRIVEFRTKHPEGSLQQVSYELVEASGSTFLMLGRSTREVYREHNFDHHFHTTIREDS